MTVGNSAGPRPKYELCLAPIGFGLLQHLQEGGKRQRKKQSFPASSYVLIAKWFRFWQLLLEIFKEMGAGQN